MCITRAGATFPFVAFVGATMRSVGCVWLPHVGLVRSESDGSTASRAVGTAKQCATEIWLPPKTSRTCSGQQSLWARRRHTFQLATGLLSISRIGR